MTRPMFVTEHVTAPGDRLGVESRYSPEQDWNRRCRGEVRSLYTRVGKTWTRAGWLCLRCATVEIEPGLVRVEHSWPPRADGLARLGVLLPVSTPGDVAQGRHQDDRHGVDALAGVGVDTEPGQDEP